MALLVDLTLLSRSQQQEKPGISQSRGAPRSAASCPSCLACADLYDKEIPPTPLGTLRLHPQRCHCGERSTEVPWALYCLCK